MNLTLFKFCMDIAINIVIMISFGHDNHEVENLIL